MADNERYLPDNPTGLPRVTPEDIEAFKNQPHDFEDDYQQLKRENPHLAHDLTTGFLIVDPEFLRAKHAFAAGALYMYMQLKRGAETHRLQALYNTSPIDDGVDGEDRPLLA